MMTLSAPAPKRRWFRFAFSLRTLFVVVTVVAIAFGWLLVHWKWIRDRQDARAWIRAHHGMAVDAGLAFIMTRPDGSRVESNDGISSRDAKLLKNLSQAPLSLRLFAEKSTYFIVLMNAGEGEPPIDVGERKAKLPELRRLFPEAELVVFPPGLSR